MLPQPVRGAKRTRRWVYEHGRTIRSREPERSDATFAGVDRARTEPHRQVDDLPVIERGTRGNEVRDPILARDPEHLGEAMARSSEQIEIVTRVGDRDATSGWNEMQMDRARGRFDRERRVLLAADEPGTCDPTQRGTIAEPLHALFAAVQADAVGSIRVALDVEHVATAHRREVGFGALEQTGVLADRRRDELGPRERSQGQLAGSSA